MKKTIHVMASVALILALGACGNKVKTDSVEVAQESNDEKFKKSDIKKDAEFVATITDIGMLEVQLGGVAQTNASSPMVKQFGLQMVEDHGKANTELGQLATQKGITTPTTLSDDSQKKYDDLSKKTGNDFDKAYTSAMVDGHKHALSLMKKESENGEDPEIKTWAQGKISTLEHHLSMAESNKTALRK